MDVSKLQGIIPDRVIASVTPDFLTTANIDGPLRLSNFLGQAEEESGKFTAESENLHYRLSALFSSDPVHPALFQKHFTSIEDATPYAGNPEMIANRVYANRMGNGDEASGDGWKYRGRGDLEITGLDNYQGFQDWLATKGITVDLVNNPDLVATAPYDLLSAAWFFSKNNLWVICDRGVDLATITTITEHVNGGTTNLQARYNYTQQIYSALKA